MTNPGRINARVCHYIPGVPGRIISAILKCTRVGPNRLAILFRRKSVDHNPYCSVCNNRRILIRSNLLPLLQTFFGLFWRFQIRVFLYEFQELFPA